MEGGAVMGFAFAMRSEATFENGRVHQSSFQD